MAKSVEQLRKEYLSVRKRRDWRGTPAEFDAAVRDFLKDKKRVSDPSPAQWVWGAEHLPIRCGRCAGTGQFITRVENGVPRGPGGACYTCSGKGYTTYADDRRNYGYWQNYDPYLR